MWLGSRGRRGVAEEEAGGKTYSKGEKSDSKTTGTQESEQKAGSAFLPAVKN